MSLANDYRPKDWGDMVEQSITTTILRNICEADTISCRNFLLTGPAGTGKTSASRLMGNKLNSGEGEVIEVDAASHSGAEAMREIVDQAKTFPIVGKYKIIIIDECHSLSSQGWQVLLKTLEESPARTVFFLCTTNPEKIPKTITSRVQQFQLSKISLKGIEERLKFVLDSEKSKGRNIQYTEDGISFLAKLANGGMRDALTLTDKVLVYSSDITSETVATALNLSNYDDFFALLNAVAKHDNVEITNIVDRVYNSGTNFVRWFEDFHSFLMNIVKYILLRDINRTMIPSHYEDKLSKYNMNHYAVCLKLANIVLTINQELRSTNYLQETVLSRLCTVPPKPATGKAE